MNNEWYHQVAQQARANVKVKYGHSPMLRNVHYRKDYLSLRRHCAEVSSEIVEILRRNRIASKTIHVTSPRGGGTHIAVFVPQDDVVIDGTINQYMKGNYKYVYKRGNYPLFRAINPQLKGRFGLVGGVGTTRNIKKLNANIQKQLETLMTRRDYLVKHNELTPERKEYFRKYEAELKKALE